MMFCKQWRINGKLTPSRADCLRPEFECFENAPICKEAKSAEELVLDLVKSSLVCGSVWYGLRISTDQDSRGEMADYIGSALSKGKGYHSHIWQPGSGPVSKFNVKILGNPRFCVLEAFLGSFGHSNVRIQPTHYNHTSALFRCTLWQNWRSYDCRAMVTSSSWCKWCQQVIKKQNCMCGWYGWWWCSRCKWLAW